MNGNQNALLSFTKEDGHLTSACGEFRMRTTSENTAADNRRRRNILLLHLFHDLARITGQYERHSLPICERDGT